MINQKTTAIGSRAPESRRTQQQQHDHGRKYLSGLKIIFLFIIVLFIVITIISICALHSLVQISDTKSKENAQFSQILPPNFFLPPIVHVNDAPNPWQKHNQDIKAFSRGWKAQNGSPLDHIGINAAFSQLNRTVNVVRSIRTYYNGHKNRKKRRFWQIWLVTRGSRDKEGLNSGFVNVRQNCSIQSRVVGILPLGSLLIGGSIRMIYLNQRERSTQERDVITRLRISFPLHGWVTLHATFLSSPLIRPLDVSFSSMRTVTNATYTIPRSAKEATIPNHDQPCANTNTFLKDVDFLGGDLPEGGLQSAADPAMCCMICSSNMQCTAWTWTAEPGQESEGQCWLKAAGFQAVPQPFLPRGAPVKQRLCVSGNINSPRLNERQQGPPFQQPPRFIFSGIPPIQSHVRKIHSVAVGDVFVDAMCCNRSNEAEIHDRESGIFNPFRGNEEYYRDKLIHVEALSEFVEGYLIHVKDYPFRILAETPWILNIARTEDNWMQKWPIGNGRFGALVGGVLAVERVPFSIAGFYARQAMMHSTDPLHGDKEGPDASMRNGEVFNEARDLFMKGYYNMASAKLGKLVKHELGMFQYLLDLHFTHHSSPLSLTSQLGNQPTQPRNGRDAMEGFGVVILSDGVLDLQHGVSHSLYLEQRTEKATKSIQKRRKHRGKARTHSVLNVHYREWFASEMDDVLVGSFSCKTLNTMNFEIEESLSESRANSSHPHRRRRRQRLHSTMDAVKKSRGCLNVAMRISREASQSAEGLPTNFIFTLSSPFDRPYGLTAAERQLWLGDLLAKGTASPAAI